MNDIEHEMDIDDALAQALSAAISTRAEDNTHHALYLTAYVVTYIRAITGAPMTDFLEILKVVDTNTELSLTKKPINLEREVEIADEDLPKQNAPSSNTVN